MDALNARLLAELDRQEQWLKQAIMNPWSRADFKRRYAHYRRILDLAAKLRTQATAKDASADRMGDPQNPDMSGSDRIAWLLQRDIAEGLRTLANELESDLADALGVHLGDDHA